MGGVGFVALANLGVLAALAVAVLWTSASYAIRPRERKLAALRPLTVALLFVVLSSLSAGMAVSLKVAADTPSGEPFVQKMLAGFAEASVVAVVGFAVIAVSWVLAAVGLGRTE